MKISNILDLLPQSLEWMVLFNLEKVRPIAGDEVTRAMFYLPETIDLNPFSHVVLTSAGRLVATLSENSLVDPYSGNICEKPPEGRTLACQFADRLSLFAIDEADCIGLGEIAGFSPVLLHLVLNDHEGHATAIFDYDPDHPPDHRHYELLRAVGVRFVDGKSQDGYYLAQFRNRLPIHIHAGILSHFERTGNCNLFFLQHGKIDSPLEQGLLEAGSRRITWGKNQAIAWLQKTTESALQSPLSMTCFPPAPEPPFAYGDLVPLGFVLRSLRDTQMTEAYAQLSAYIISQQQEFLWAFHQKRLITATDSALVMQGLTGDLSATYAALEQFSDGQGYYPQLWAESSLPHRMIKDPSCTHWCQTDFATTAMIRALQLSNGIEPKTPITYLTDKMAERSGLYFANPYLVDYYLALALQEDTPTSQLARQQLLEEVLSSRNKDLSFGYFDIPLSTALAILTIAALGSQGRIMRASQLRLLDFLDSAGSFPASIPFYSSLRLDASEQSDFKLKMMQLNLFADPRKRSQIQQIGEEYHSISLYVDNHKMISTALAVSALNTPCHVETYDIDRLPPVNAHPRYRCRDQISYIAKFALRPYVEVSAN
ncbi:hypothetical protein VB774_20870 [Pseudanabaena galeata UHCC 0370]|jgi:hypothetical protein|uniref:YcaO domain-containing protein n=1 Tax=Pseudanabaena galeata UHCC 0370 TaxID=3110310 RepID=A0ABU5TP84_9CYAN|nr:hypothetical protein [Pseudanabaena galeata]MEA5480089.1 hypothetical protein [Pseudanabaena galeata UHCC 0370]